MEPSLEAIYTELIIDHARHPVGKGLREPYTAEVHHINPTCGDELVLRVELGPGEDPVLTDISYDGTGCNISMASVSILAEMATGQPLAAFGAQYQEFLRMMHGMGKVTPDEELLGDATAFAGVAQLPMRIKCALLGWMAVHDAVGQSLAAPVAEGEES